MGFRGWGFWVWCLVRNFTEGFQLEVKGLGLAPSRLGSTSPCRIAVHMEPFSTSAVKVLISMLATADTI